jgi:putative methyltransferase (TIGR04325 family)
MNEALEKYEKENQVSCISGYVYPLTKKLDEAFFIKGADCWGWATWKDQWEILNKNASELLSKIENNDGLKKDFSFNNSYPYLEMLKDRAEGKNQSWAILWYASAFLNERLCLYPPQTLVKNIGNDGSGTHTLISTKELNQEFFSGKDVLLPNEIKENKQARLLFEYFLNSRNKSKRLINKIKKIIPAQLKLKLKKILKPENKSQWSGDYSSWEELEKKCKGYDSPLILNNVKNAVLKVKNGEAAYERDSVLFNKVEYSVPVLELFNKILSENDSIGVVDFGGSLGSSYFQYGSLLNQNKKIKWAVVEQPHFVDTGNKEIANDHLKFFDDVNDAITFASNNILFLSGVLPYIKEPYKLLDKLMNKNFKYVVVDRMPFIERDADRLTMQIVPSEIYEASYPAWFFNEKKFISFFDKYYVAISEFENTLDPKEYLGKDYTFRKGFIFKRRHEV